MTPRLLVLASMFAVAAFPAVGSAQGIEAVRLASADCSRAAAKAAAQTGGRVLTVSSRNQDGRVVCVVTVIVPSNDGGRPRKQTLVMPQ